MHTPRARRNGAVFLAVLVAAIVVELWGGNRLARNLVIDAGVAALLLSAVAGSERIADLPFPRGRTWSLVVPAFAALIVALPALGLPYIEDDYQHLEVHRGQLTPLHALEIARQSKSWFRPVVWSWWWCVSKLSPSDATFARAQMALVFAACAALVVPALRRCGIPRGVAVASALLFAVHPAALDTLGLTVNQEVLFSAAFSLAAIACLPGERGRRGSMIPSVAFATLAFLSKEDSFLLPVLAFAAGARFRLRTWRVGVRVAWPIAAALAAVIAVRVVLLGGFGGYQGPLPGTSIVAERAVAGPLNALVSECPAGYVVPIREGGGPLARVCALAPALLLALGGASRSARRGVPRGLAIAAIGLAPTSSLLPVGPDLALVRELFFPAVGIALASASLVAGIALGRRGRWWGIAALAALSFAVGRRNFDAWTRSGQIIRDVHASAGPIVAGAPLDGRVLMLGLPAYVDGALCFAPWGVSSIAQVAGRPDVKCFVPQTAIGALDRIVEFDVTTRTARDVSRLESAIPISAGQRVRLQLPVSSECERIPLLRWGPFRERLDPWYFVNGRLGDDVSLGTYRVPANAELAVECDGRTRTLDGLDVSMPVFATYAKGARLERVALSGPLRMPAEVTSVRLDVLPMMCPTTREIVATITAREP